MTSDSSPAITHPSPLPPAVAACQGSDQFGPAYRVMLEHDTHAPGSVDRVGIEHMIRLCEASAGFLYSDYTPTAVRYRPGCRPHLETVRDEIFGDVTDVEKRVRRLARFCRCLGARAGETPIEQMRFGGREEQIIQRGSDWCTDVSRVACALLQTGGIPARIVFQANADRPYSGHVIVEAFRNGSWGAVDPTCNVVYRHPDGRPASVWELMNAPDLLQSHYRNAGTAYTNPAQFALSALVNYDIADADHYRYDVVPLNEYSRRVLELSLAGWPGGRRWLFGEEEGKCEM
jgi:hypothetical protein